MFHTFILITIFATTLASKSPVLIWSSSRALSDLPQSYTGQTVDSNEFYKSYLHPLTSKSNLVLFVQDRLSLQDLNEHADVYNAYSDGGAFKNLKSFMDDQFSVQLPSVMSPWESLQKVMKKFEGKVHKVMDAADLSNIDLTGSANLIIVSLKPVQGAIDERKTLAENDAKIADVVQHLTKRDVKFTAAYTGKTAAKVSDVQAGVSRRLQAVDTIQCDNCTFVNKTCPGRKSPVYFYMRSIKVFAEINQKKNNLSTTVVKMEDDGTTCDNDTVTLKLKTESNVEGLNMALEWYIVKDNISEYWSINENYVYLDWNMNSTVIKANETLMGGSMSAPKDFSYHCSTFNMKQMNGTDANITLAFDGLQVQPFNVMDDKFADGWDCVVFFTPGIWMAIVSVLVMTLIILYGLEMISSLKTMDRYDDPKGKTITVNVNE